MLTINSKRKARTPLEHLLSTAETNSLYDKDVLNSLESDGQKLKYLEMLSVANTLALDNRLSSIDYAGISDKMLKFQVLETEYNLAVQQQLDNDPQYQQAAAQTQMQRLNETFGSDARISGNAAIKTIVDTKYAGDYSHFMREYEGEDAFFADDYLAFADKYNEQETRDTLKYMQENAKKLTSDSDATGLLLQRRAQLLTNVAIDKQLALERAAYENASFVTKWIQTSVQATAAIGTELGNVIEGVLDAVALVGVAIGATAEKISGESIDTQGLRNFINKDIIPLDTLLAEALPYSCITSPYAPDNPAKWLYEVETSLIDMTPLALNLVVPGLGSTIYYTSSAGRTGEAYNMEYSDAGDFEVFGYTAVSTGIEILTERLSGDVVFGKGWTDSWIKIGNNKPALKFLKEMVGEGVEEILSETGSQITASILRGENKMNGQQILRAGALGAATSVFLQTGNSILTRRKLLGIRTRLINPISGNSLELSARESALVDDFLHRCELDEKAGKTLSKRDQQLYDTYQKYERSWFISKKYAQLRFTAKQREYTKEQVTETTEIEQEPAKTAEDVVSQVTQDNIAQVDAEALAAAFAELNDAVETSLDEDTIDTVAQKILPDNLTESMSTELKTMAAVWANSLLADEGRQDVLDAVNSYYTSTLTGIVDRLAAKPVSDNALNNKRRTTIRQALADDTIELVAPDKNDLIYARLVQAVRTTYKDYSVNAFTTGNVNTPTVFIIDQVINDRHTKAVHINYKYIRGTNITSIIKQVEAQMITTDFYSTLSEKSREWLNNLVSRFYTGVIPSTLRYDHCAKQILYNAIFLPNNELSIQLSELDNESYEGLRDYLAERIQNDNVAIRYTAYRGLLVYDLTILQRMSADEAVEKNLLSANYSIEDLLERRGPDNDRLTFKYGIDASITAVRVYSAVRHLQDHFGFTTDIGNIYTVLANIKNSENYTKLADLHAVLQLYGDRPFSDAINLYLRDQFNIEIDHRGNILATADVDSIIDRNAIELAIKNKSTVSLVELVKPESRGVVTDDCIVRIIDAFEANAFKRGEHLSGVTGKSLIQVAVKSSNIDIAVRDAVHEIQHYFTTHNHQPFGASLFFDNASITESVYETIKDSPDRGQFIHDMAVFIKNNTFVLEYETIADINDKILEQKDYSRISELFGDPEQLKPLFLAVNSIIYDRFDFNEQQSNFVLRPTTLDATGAYFSTSGRGIAVLNVNEQALKKHDAFLKYFDGRAISVKATDIEAKLSKISGGTETFDAIISSANTTAVESVDESKSVSSDVYEKLKATLALNGTMPTVAQLCQPRFWLSNCTDPELKTRVAGWTSSDCKRMVESLTGLVFDDYAGEFVKPGDRFKTAEHILYTSPDSIVISRGDRTVIQLPRDYEPGKYTALDRAINSLSDDQRNNAAYYVDDRIFMNLREAMLFTNSAPVSAAGKGSNVALAAFDQLIDSLPESGFAFNADMVFVTHDGKVMAYDTKGAPGEFFKALAERFKLPWKVLSQGLQVDVTTGKYIGNLEAGILKQLLNAKKLMRAYRVGDTWEAYGKPNYRQDLLLRQLNVTNPDVSYLEPDSDQYQSYVPGKARLVVNDNGRVGIDIHGNTPYSEVTWKDKVWYKSLMQIIEKYDIRKLSELQQLGFNQDFIDSITRNYGRAIQSKTAGKLKLGERLVEKSHRYIGVEQSVITQFINDDAAHPFARNLLIQNAPVRDTETENLNWRRCSHLRTVEDIEAYFRAMIQYRGTLLRTRNYKRYSSLNDLLVAVKESYIATDAERSLAISPEYQDVVYDNLFSLFLNIDSRQEGKIVRATADGQDAGARLITLEGLDYSLAGFNAAAGNINRNYAASKKSVTTVRSEQQTTGAHADDETTVNLADTSIDAQLKSLLSNAETMLITEENRQYYNEFKRMLKIVRKQYTANNSNQALETIKNFQSYLSRENDKIVAGESQGTWDEYLGLLREYATKLSTTIESGRQLSTAAQSMDDFIREATARIEQAADKRAAQDSEYQALTNNRARLIKQFSEAEYRRALDAIKGLSDGKKVSNVKDNISKRLRDSGSSSIYARIREKFDTRAHDKLLDLADQLKTLNLYFNGIQYGTEGRTEMWFEYSQLLTDFYKWLDILARGSSAAKQQFDNIKAKRSEIIAYLSNQVLYNDAYNFTIFGEDAVAYLNMVKELASGKITMPELEDFKNASHSDRVNIISSLITDAINQRIADPVVDKMQQILEDLNIPESTDEARKPSINLDILRRAQANAGLSEEMTKSLTETISKITEQKTESKAERSAQKQQLVMARNAAYDAKHLAWTYDHLTREYRKYSASPAITQEQAESLIRHAAKMIEIFDFQSRTDAYAKRAKKAWKDDKSAYVKKAKAILYYKKHSEWPKYFDVETYGSGYYGKKSTKPPSDNDVALARSIHKSYIDRIVDEQSDKARDIYADRTQKRAASIVKQDDIPEFAREHLAEYIAAFEQEKISRERYTSFDGQKYSGLAAVEAKAADEYDEVTFGAKERIDAKLKRYLLDHPGEKLERIIKFIGYDSNDAVSIRKTQALIDLMLDLYDGKITDNRYEDTRDKILKTTYLADRDTAIASAVSTYRHNIRDTAKTIWMNRVQANAIYLPLALSRESTESSEAPTPLAVPLGSISKTVTSVDDLLAMYIEPGAAVTPDIDTLPITQRYYTTHRSLDELLANAALQSEIYQSDEHQKLNSIINGISLAVTEFQYRPMTLASAIKFIADVRTVLADGIINNTLFSWKREVSVDRLRRTAFRTMTLGDGSTATVDNSIASFNLMLEELRKGVFNSRAQEIEAAMKEAEASMASSIEDMVSGIPTLIDILKDITTTEDDKKPKGITDRVSIRHWYDDPLYNNLDMVTRHFVSLMVRGQMSVAEVAKHADDILKNQTVRKLMRKYERHVWKKILAFEGAEDSTDLDSIDIESADVEDAEDIDIENADVEDDAEDASMQAALMLALTEVDPIEDVDNLLRNDTFTFDGLEVEGADADTEDAVSPPKTEPKTEPKPKAEKAPAKPKVDERPLDEQFKKDKTLRSRLLRRQGVDIARALEYQFQKTTAFDVYGQQLNRQQVNTMEFITNPEVSKIINSLLSNNAAMTDFLDWLSDAQEIDEITSLKALILLNKIEANPTIPFEIRRKAEEIRRYKKSIAAAILGLGNRHGLTPVEEVNLLAMKMLSLDDTERKTLDALAKRQKAAIDRKDFKEADAIMKDALAIFQKHQHELDIRINPFGKTEHSEELAEAKRALSNAENDVVRKDLQQRVEALQEMVDGERAVRWHNLTNQITTWRFFAMLSAPATFFSKNIGGNYVAKGLNRVSEAISEKFEEVLAKKRGFKYTYGTGKVSDAARQAVAVQLEESGILEGLMSNTVAKYETGYAYRPSAVRNITVDAAKDELGPDKYSTLKQLLRPDAPFGKMNEQGKTNIFAEALNKMYSVIFNTMNDVDRKFMRADILRMTERLVSANFTANELVALSNKTADEALLAKFYEIVEFARQDACATYFRSQPKIYNDIMALLSKYPMAQAIVSIVMPFPRMVVNATMTALKYSPIGYIKMLMTLKHDKSMFANIRASQDFGKATVGTFAMVAGIILAALGVLDLDDEDPYTGPQLAIGDLHIALEGLEPSATPFIVGAMAVLGHRYDNAGVFTSAANALLESTILGEVMSQFGNDSTGTKWIGSIFASFVTQFIPTIMKRAAQLIDAGKKDYTGKARTLKRIAAATPFLSLLVDNKVDPYTGEDKVQHADNNDQVLSRFLVLFNAISPTKISYSGDSAVELESKAVGAETTGPAKSIKKNGVDYPIPKKLYDKYKVLRAKLYSQYASKLIATEGYKKLSNEKKAQKLKALQTRATNEARKQLNIADELNIP